MEELSKQCYACPAKKLYPVHTKQAALSSYQEFKKDIDNYSADQIDAIASNFIKSAAALDFKYPEDEVNYAQPEVQVIEAPNGFSVKMSKVASIQDVNKVLDTLEDSRESLEMSFIRKIAKSVFDQADQMGLEGEGMLKLEKWAGLGTCDPVEVVQEFRKRGALINIPDKMESEFYATYRELEKQQDGQELVKNASVMCDVLSGIDQMYKLAQFYGTRINKPEDVCFRYGVDDCIEAAQDYLHVPSTGTIMSKKAVLEEKEAVKDFFKSKYGQDIEDDEKLLEKVSSLSASGIKALIEVLD